MSVMLVLVFLFIAGIAGVKFALIMKGMAMGKLFAPPPPSVTIIVAKTQTWQPVLSVIGSLKAVNGVTVSTDLAGIVSEIAFESGASVKKGDLLVRLDTRQEAAQLRSAEARRDLTEANLDRQRELISKKAVAQTDFDSANSEFRQADAAVEQARAMIARKTILAPFDGLLGIRQANVGQYLNVGASIVPLQSLDPIYVQFALPQQHLDQVAAGGKLRISASGIKGEEFEGRISAIDSLVDESTRNILIQGTVANPGEKLRPGMFVNVEVLLPETPGVVAVPASSINYAPLRDSVFIVRDKAGPDGKPAQVVEEHFVKLGPSRGDQVSILSGVKEGDRVVTSGAFKLQSGLVVKISDLIRPGNELNPNVPDT